MKRGRPPVAKPPSPKECADLLWTLMVPPSWRSLWTPPRDKRGMPTKEHAL